MVKMETKYSCGCGFKTVHMIEACKHVETTKHTINSISGKIIYQEEEKNGKPYTTANG